MMNGKVDTNLTGESVSPDLESGEATQTMVCTTEPTALVTTYKTVASSPLPRLHPVL